ncbi:tetratricopeptide repeat protein [Flavobacterium sp.]|uniref:tetratricopeptide repeat protein n=1 Tax=Flavobacterium sp. TaxID=239 RepID=UPI003750048B
MINYQIKKILVLFVLCQFGCNSTQDCPEGINLLPMYGNLKKCDSQVQMDTDFIIESEKQFKNRKLASEYYVSKGWQYFYENNYDLSMKRFNQAWLLDNKNANVYWGFGNLLGLKKDYKSSISFFEKSIKINPKNSKVYESLSTSYGQIFFETKDIKYINLTIESLKKAVKIEPNNGRMYGQLASAYSYFNQKDSLVKYIKITDNIDPKFVNPEVRKFVKNK